MFSKKRFACRCASRFRTSPTHCASSASPPPQLLVEPATQQAAAQAAAAAVAPPPVVPRHTSVEAGHLTSRSYLATREACRSLAATNTPGAAISLRAAAYGEGAGCAGAGAGAGGEGGARGSPARMGRK